MQSGGSRPASAIENNRNIIIQELKLSGIVITILMAFLHPAGFFGYPKNPSNYPNSVPQSPGGHVPVRNSAWGSSSLSLLVVKDLTTATKYEMGFRSNTRTKSILETAADQGWL